MIVITGANGFIGEHATAALIARGIKVRTCVRRSNDSASFDAEQIEVGDLGPDTDWTAAVRGAKCVLHLAGKAHVASRGDARLEAAFRRVNVESVVALARAAISADVSRFVLVSSIGVSGSLTRGRPFTESDPAAPSDFYALTKFEAEQCVRRLSGNSSMEVVIVRPTLVAGARAPGNLGRLAALVRLGIPLPIAGIRNQRSLVGVRSLADLLALCCVHPAAAGRLFLAADDPPLSTAEIVAEIARGLGARARLLRVPPALLKFAGGLAGRSREVAQLCGSLVVDASSARSVLGWPQCVPIQVELRELGKATKPYGAAQWVS